MFRRGIYTRIASQEVSRLLSLLMCYHDGWNCERDSSTHSDVDESECSDIRDAFSIMPGGNYTSFAIG